MKILRFIPLLVCFLIIITVGGAYATWNYAVLAPPNVQQNVNISLSVFDYPPEQILPGGDTETAPLGENHLKLIELILWEDDKDYGLNINNNAVIHQYLKSHKVVYSNQKISGGNMKFILDSRHNTHGLYYCVEKVSDTLYYCYTFDVNALSTASGTSKYITVYRTSLVKTDQWKATTAYEGVAQTKRLSELGESPDSHSLSYSIDTTTWRLPFTQ